MILFISEIGASLPIVYRMRQENIDAKIYIHKESYRHCYDGIIEKVELQNLKKEIEKARKIVFDSDVDLSALGNGIKEKSICYPIKLDEEVVRQTVGLKSKDVPGIKLITEMWFDGKEPILYSYCLPGKHWLTGNLGLEMSSQTNCLWVAGESGVFTEILDTLIPILEEECYIGPISLELIIGKDKKPYYQGFHIGMKYDNIFCLLEILGESYLSLFIENGVLTNRGFACSERVTIAPYPYQNGELLEGIAKGVKFETGLGNGFWCQDIKDGEDGLSCAGNDGLIGIMTATGSHIEDGFGKVYKAIRKLKVEAPLQFRIDGLRETTKKYKKLNSWSLF